DGVEPEVTEPLIRDDPLGRDTQDLGDDLPQLHGEVPGSGLLRGLRRGRRVRDREGGGGGPVGPEHGVDTVGAPGERYELAPGPAEELAEQPGPLLGLE